MNKMNKKGFTLIEMLVVIAIIAILVAIIVPTVTASTAKAQAATDAANLRSAKAAITIGLLDGSINATNKDTTCTPEKLGIPATSKHPDGGGFECTITGQVVTVEYGDMDINDFAIIAGGGAS